MLVPEFGHDVGVNRVIDVVIIFIRWHYTWKAKKKRVETTEYPTKFNVSILYFIHNARYPGGDISGRQGPMLL